MIFLVFLFLGVFLWSFIIYIILISRKLKWTISQRQDVFCSWQTLCMGRGGVSLQMPWYEERPLPKGGGPEPRYWKVPIGWETWSPGLGPGLGPWTWARLGLGPSLGPWARLGPGPSLGSGPAWARVRLGAGPGLGPGRARLGAWLGPGPRNTQRIHRLGGPGHETIR